MAKLLKDMVLKDEYGEEIVLEKGTQIISVEQQKRNKDYYEQTQTSKELSQTIKNNCGDFVWSLFNPSESYIPELNEEFLSKLIYLATYIEYDTNALIINKGQSHTKCYMTKSDVQSVIGLGEKQFRKFWKEMHDKDFVCEDADGVIYMNFKFHKGKLQPSELRAVKLFIHSIRYLYENTDNRSHRYLAYLYRLIPYINLKHNVMCDNPLETKPQLIRPLTAKEICERLGLDVTNQTKLINKLFTLSFIDKNGDKRSVIRIVTDAKNNERRNFITINPQFYCGYISETDLLETTERFLLSDAMAKVTE